MGPCRYQLSEPIPLNRIGDSHFQRNPIAASLKQRSTQRGEGTDRIRERGFRAGNCLVMQALRFSPGFSYDPVMGFDYSIGNRRFPLHNADGKDRPAAIRSDVTQTVGEVAFALSTQAGNAMGRYTDQNTMIDIQGTQKLQSVEQAVSGSRVVTYLEIAKPDEATDIAGEHFAQKFIQALANIRS
ncbi:hypothetical protein XBKQ1_960009 [Xenorhabdus bovienii str. kraussei Quebec]|uniref:Uncharacterized protein n=1 Tax=Xenorhabdus bovienii str. kraussei Quebec TaxID=1398203 RepID=A0A077PNN9_XENBV|nr:hypothetical protein XBKQ1_960009 [Xenorhabdus bovienii str. kraussei Quebec]